MQTLHLISHTHWDREWYRPFQSFRLRLVHLVDGLLDLLASDPEYRVFMLDGQTIMLDDYLEVRPEQAGILREYVRAGRLLVGPWHILPDEFLVSPEATIRNLLKGAETASRFGGRMEVGYTPDPFGHIGQLPQILRGFGIEAACLQRGLSEEPVELWWDAPDGSRVFLAYLRGGYGNGATLVFDDFERSVAQIERIRAILSPHARTSHLLVMQGTDHMEAVAGTPRGIQFANRKLEGCQVIHSTLPAYLAAVKEELERNMTSLPVITGELRSPLRSPLLPGVLSTRMWIKQRNHACQQLLERWAEPFSTLASLVLAHTPVDPIEQLAWVERIDRPAGLIRRAWDLLMECHPHDSICGCSIDQVHVEMLPRFDHVEQIAGEIALQNLRVLAEKVQTTAPVDDQEIGQAFIVFNPSSQARSDQVEVAFQVSNALGRFEIVDETGDPLPFQIIRTSPPGEVSLTYSRNQFLRILWQLQSREFPGGVIDKVSIDRKGDGIWIEIERKNTGAPDEVVIQKSMAEITRALEDPDLDEFHFIVRTPVSLDVRFIARDVPGIGYRTFWVRPVDVREEPAAGMERYELENEYFQIRLDPEDGSFTVRDKRTGVAYPGMNHFVDGGDAGDEYNYNPPLSDRFVSPTGEGDSSRKHGWVSDPGDRA